MEFHALTSLSIFVVLSSFFVSVSSEKISAGRRPSASVGSYATISGESRLTKYLLENHERLGGPEGAPHGEGVNVTEGVQVNVRYDPNTVFVEFSNLITEGWLYTSWRDRRLQWDPSDFYGIELLVVPLKAIWSPDIVLINAVNPSVRFYSENLNVQISQTGDVFLQSRYKFTGSGCVKEAYKNVECPLNFGSLSFPSTKLRVVSSNGGETVFKYINNKRVSMRSAEVYREHSCCPGMTYSDISYTIAVPSGLSYPTAQ